MSLSVVMPAYECQDKLELTLAALAHQHYPQELFEVVIADDGSSPPLQLPSIAPANTRLIRLDREAEWGRARACHAGAMAAQGEILLFLDADMVVFPDHLRAHARWHHVLADAVTLGHKLFAQFDGITVEDVVATAQRNAMDGLVGDRPRQEHEWVEQFIERTGRMTRYHPELFKAAVGSTVGMRAALYAETGGFRPNLRAGEDMEIGYRLMAAGAVFVPERQARSWHQGPATYMSRAEEVRRRNNPHFANYVPVPGRFRPHTPGRQYAVPMVTVLVSGHEAKYEDIKRCVDALLASEETDLRVEVSCRSESEDYELLHAEYQDDVRVRLHPKLPESGFPSRFTVQLPAWAAVSPVSLGALTRRLERDRVGVIQVVMSDAAEDERILVWRTSALHRARRHDTPQQPLHGVAARLFGSETAVGTEFGLVDLRLRASAGRLPAPSTGGGARRIARLERRLAVLRQRRAEERAELRVLRRRLRRMSRRYDRLHVRYHRLRARRVVRAVDAVARILRGNRV